MALNDANNGVYLKVRCFLEADIFEYIRGGIVKLFHPPFFMLKCLHVKIQTINMALYCRLMAAFGGFYDCSVGDADVWQ